MRRGRGEKSGARMAEHKQKGGKRGERWVESRGEAQIKEVCTRQTREIFFCSDAAWVSPGRFALQSAKPKTGMCNGPLNKCPKGELSNKLDKRRISKREGPMKNG